MILFVVIGIIILFEGWIVMRLLRIGKENGFLMIAVIILIFVLGFLVIAISYLVTSEATSTANKLYASRAFYAAESGLEKGIYDYSKKTLACNGTPNAVENFGEGEFQNTCSNYNSAGIITIISSGGEILSNSTVISVSTLSGLAPMGTVAIGGGGNPEYVNYKGTSSSSTVCGTFPGNSCEDTDKNPIPCLAPCLINITRGARSSSPKDLKEADEVTQDQDIISSTGGVPTLTDPKGKSTNLQAVYRPTSTLGWAGGATSKTLLQWDGTNWPLLATLDLGSIKAIACADNTHCWAGGTKTNLLLQWDGTSWSTIAPTYNGAINAIACADNTHCWAGGAVTAAPLLQWNGGSSWTSVASASGAGIVYAISCADSTHCWAGGGSTGSFLQWNGSTWSLTTNPMGKVSIYAIDCADSTTCFLGGANKTNVYRWASGSWNNPYAHNLGQNINAIGCADSTHCWTGSTGSKSFSKWEGGASWTLQSNAASAIGSVNAIACADSTTCFMGGNTSTVLLQWNGSTWSTKSGTGNVGAVSAIGFKPNLVFSVDRLGWRKQMTS